MIRILNFFIQSNYLKCFILISLCFFYSCDKKEVNNASVSLQNSIDNYQDHKGYDKEQICTAR